MDKPNAAAVATMPPVSAHPTPIATPQPTKTKNIVAKHSAINFLNIMYELLLLKNYITNEYMCLLNKMCAFWFF